MCRQIACCDAKRCEIIRSTVRPELGRKIKQILCHAPYQNGAACTLMMQTNYDKLMSLTDNLREKATQADLHQNNAFLL